jgi:membrane protein DedA with SNARE-associated domain/membrane-associated phospholipid phosphatase
LLQDIINLIRGIGAWAYLIIFLGTTLESSALTGLFIPGESLMMLGGFLAERGTLSLGVLIPLASVGAILGDSISYELGRYFGVEWLLKYARWAGLRHHHLQRMDRLFERHGGRAVLFGRFLTFLRTLAPFVAGASRMRYSEFFRYNALGAILWAASFNLAGYLLGASWRAVEQWFGRASTFILLGVGAAIGLFLVRKWFSRNEKKLRRWWHNVWGNPVFEAMRRSFAPVSDFLRARLSPGGYLGLHFTVGMLIFIGAVALFTTIAEDVVAGTGFIILDHHLAQWLHAHATPRFTALMFVVTAFGSVPIVAGVSLLVAALLIWHRDWDRLLTLALSVPGGSLVNVVMKEAFQRPRPSLKEAFVHLTSYSFPSGHAMSSVLLYGLLAIFAIQSFEKWDWRVSSALAGIVMIALIGFSRLYLGAHYLSDVLGGVLEGVAWLALCLTAVGTLRRTRELHREK